VLQVLQLPRQQQQQHNSKNIVGLFALRVP
jgi:hypothetical protein